MIHASAPGKVILLGEHSVVYGRPAIAVPVSQVRATASVDPAPPGSGLTLVAPDLNRSIRLKEAASDDPLAAIASLTLACLDSDVPDAVLTVTSTIPIAGGMGSGAAVSTAVARALAAFVGARLSPSEVSRLVFEVERLHHGTPSGIDNTVVAYERPVYFVQGQPPEMFRVGASLHLLIADTGIPSPTRKVVEAVRRKRESEPVHYDFLFDRIGDLVEEARSAIEEGDPYALGFLLDQNHELLQEMGASSPELDELVDAARMSGALGAKLSGAGRGGNMVALVEEETAEEVGDTLKEAGAVRIIRTVVE
ncbi:MAG TPA: mevalonate kinase [Chloroflexi bacterium]|nr:mevalonate kinase [Chloroflexota bacterium]